MRKVISFIGGLLMGTIIPLLPKIQALTGISLMSKVYFLGKILPVAVGVLLTDFLLLFAIGFVVSLVDKKYNFYKLLSMGLLVSIIGAIIISNGNFVYMQPDIIKIILFVVYMLLFAAYMILGGLFYKLVINKK